MIPIKGIGITAHASDGHLSPEGVGDGASNQTAQDQIRMAATTKIHWIRSLLCSKITVGVARNWGRAFFNLTETRKR